MIRLNHIIKEYGTRRVLNRITLRFPKTGFLAIVGPSGCGKTTLLNILSGIDEKYQGDYLFKNKSVDNLTREQKSAFRLLNVGYVFQDFRLFENDSVLNNLLLPLDVLSNDEAEFKKRHVSSLLDLVGLSHKKDVAVNLLSGGEKQRVAIARAMVNNPAFILCDEPTGSLDAGNAIKVMDILKSISAQRLVIVVSHDEELVTRYCDDKVTIVDGMITGHQKFERTAIKKKITFQQMKKANNKLHMPFKTMLRRALSIIKTRKYRVILNNSMMSLGLLGIGLSIIMSFSIQERIVTGFSRVIKDGMIVMSKKGDETPITAYSASFENVSKIAETYRSWINGIGVSYAVNFESFFQDRDEMFISSTAYKIILPRFSARQINDFLWLDEIESNHQVYPFQQASMDNDEIVIGLPHNEMVGICYSLRIERNYASLGEYISSARPLVTLGIANGDWGYEDEQIFHLSGVIPNDTPAIYHTNHLWSEYVFQEKMRIPSIDDGKYEFPWQMAKSYFVTTKENPETFLEVATLEKPLRDFVFEMAGFAFHPTHCPMSGPCLLNRLLVFHVDKDTIDVSALAQIMKKEHQINNHLYATDGGYYYHPNSFLAGFAKNIFISLSDTQIEKAIDADSLIASENDNMIFEPPPGVFSGNIQTSMDGGVSFSSDLREVIYGRKPINLDEIAISETLAHKFLSPVEMVGKKLLIATNYANIAYDNDRIEKQYSLTETTIVGIIRGSGITLHHRPYWSLGFFQLKGGISAFELIPKHVIFEIDKNGDSELLVEKLNKQYGEFDFYDPMKTISDGLDETMSFIRVVLFAFSSLAVLTSLFLFFIVMFVTIEENRRDIILLDYLGISKSAIRRSFIVCGLVVSSLAFFLSSLEIIILDYFVTHVIAGFVGTNIPYVFDYRPLAAILAMSVVIAVAASYAAFEKQYSSFKKQFIKAKNFLKNDR